MLLMFSLGRPDVLPVGDYGVRKGAMIALRPRRSSRSRAELEAVAEPWRPYRSVASWYLWRHVEAILPAGAAGAHARASARGACAIFPPLSERVPIV